MFRTCFFHACGLAAWLSLASVAFGQSDQYGQYGQEEEKGNILYHPFVAQELFPVHLLHNRLLFLYVFVFGHFLIFVIFFLRL